MKLAPQNIWTRKNIVQAITNFQSLQKPNRTMLIADKISEFLGEPLISIYKPGGGGSLGAAFVAKAKPDGYVALVGSPVPLVLSPIVKKLDYKLDDFIPTGAYGKSSHWLAVKADAKWKNLKEFIDDAKKNPGKLIVSSYGRLTLADFAIELLKKQAGIKFNHVPYKSSGEALTAVLGGHADAGMVSGAGGLLESGTIRILANAAEQRLEDLPHIPIFKEFGYPIVIDANYSLCFPKGTPKEFVEYFCNAQQKAIGRYSKEIKEGLRRAEISAEFLSAEDTMQRWKSYYNFYFKIAEELGVVAK